MLPFFRKIRYRLAKDNQFFKYSRYAIGEIVLVVIGILIALQINNWNTDRKNRKLEKETLSNLKVDLIIQEEIIQRHLNYEKHFLLKVDSALSMINSKIEIRKFETLLDSLSRRLTFVSNTVTFENMGLEGNISIISNSDLRKELRKYYQKLDYTESVINNNNIFRTNNQFGTFVLNNPLGLGLNNTELIEMKYELSPEKRYILKKQLEGRKYSLLNNIEKCSIQSNSTKILIALVDKELDEE